MTAALKNNQNKFSVKRNMKQNFYTIATGGGQEKLLESEQKFRLVAELDLIAQANKLGLKVGTVRPFKKFKN